MPKTYLYDYIPFHFLLFVLSCYLLPSLFVKNNLTRSAFMSELPFLILALRLDSFVYEVASGSNSDPLIRASRLFQSFLNLSIGFVSPSSKLETPTLTRPLARGPQALSSSTVGADLTGRPSVVQSTRKCLACRLKMHILKSIAPCLVGVMHHNNRSRGPLKPSTL